MIEGNGGEGPESGAGGASQAVMNNSQSMNSMLKKGDDDMVILRMKRYKMNESNLLIMETKNKIISILQRILDI